MDATTAPASATALGAPVERREGREKVTGTARYAAEQPRPGRAHAWPVPASIARGRVTGIDTAAALAVPGVLAVLTHQNAPRLSEPEDPTLGVLRDSRVPHRGWFVALVVGETLEAARAGAGCRARRLRRGGPRRHPHRHAPGGLRPRTGQRRIPGKP